MLFGWLLAGILTVTGVLPDDPSNIQFKARTDARTYVITNAKWFHLPYPGKYNKLERDCQISIKHHLIRQWSN